MRLFNAVAIGAAVAALSAPTHGVVVINELLGSTSGADWEFIELYNSGTDAVNISGWTLSLFDSDDGVIGTLDGGSPFTINSTSPLAAGDFYLLSNALANSGFGVTPDEMLTGSVENSSYTAVLKDAAGATQYTAFVNDGGIGDTPNDAGTTIVPDVMVGPTILSGGGFALPAGFYLIADGVSAAAELNFDTTTLTGNGGATGSPGFTNAIPEPATAGLIAAGILLAARRRK